MSISSLSARQESEKIVRLKMQCAKVMLREKRVEGARLILESVDHPAADALLERLSTATDIKSKTPSWMQQTRLIVVSVVVIALVAGFSLGRMTAPAIAAEGNGQQVGIPEMLDGNGASANQMVSTPAPDYGEVINAEGTPMQAYYMTMTSVHVTQSALNDILNVSATAEYLHATQTAEAKASSN